MKIGILSDIHVDINLHQGKDDVTPAICRFIRENKLDIFIIAGDIAGDYTLTLNSINRIEKETGKICLFVPGNHDIWTEKHPGKTSWDIYNKLKSHPHNLSAGPYSINSKWTVIGDLGWYDYKFGNRKYSIEDFDRMQYKDRIWQDSIKAVWGISTLEMHAYFLKKLDIQLNEQRDKNIILVTHVLPIEDFTVQQPSLMWEYLNAFMGSPDYGNLVKKYPDIKYSISGHVHYRKKLQKNNTAYICSCLGYSSEWQGNDDPFIEVAKAVISIEI